MRSLLIAFLTFSFFPFIEASNWTKGSASVTFSGSSTLHKFSGQGTALPFDTQPDRNQGLLSWQAILPIESMDTGLAKRDANMRDMFHYEQNPVIAATFDHVAIESIKKGDSLPSTITMNDTQKSVLSEVTEVSRDGQRIQLKLKMPIRLNEFHLDPPSAFFFIRVANEVSVEIDLTFYQG